MRKQTARWSEQPKAGGKLVSTSQRDEQGKHFMVVVHNAGALNNHEQRRQRQQGAWQIATAKREAAEMCMPTPPQKNVWAVKDCEDLHMVHVERGGQMGHLRAG